MMDDWRFNQIAVGPPSPAPFESITINVTNQVFDPRGVWYTTVEHNFVISFDGDFAGQDCVIDVHVPHDDGRPLTDTGNIDGQQWFAGRGDDAYLMQINRMSRETVIDYRRSHGVAVENVSVLGGPYVDQPWRNGGRQGGHQYAATEPGRRGRRGRGVRGGNQRRRASRYRENRY